MTKKITTEVEDLFSGFDTELVSKEEKEAKKASPDVSEKKVETMPSQEESRQEAVVEEAFNEVLPQILSDGKPFENDGELTLARYAAKAYLEYALSVVKSRALPDVVDGMKPVQRRILYAMDRMKLAPPAKPVKCARVVGDVLGKYHPHGDQAAYEAMVRMAQDFTLRYPLVDGEGNFGSRDGDGAAAMRYTEARLTKISELLLGELDSESVDFIPNYDGSFKEPALLPAKLPFVLLNGASGIAVGMATEIPSHNLTEIGNAVLLLLEKPNASLDEVLALCPAPDFPGGGQIINKKDEIRAVYSTGRGSLKVRARYHFEDLQRGQWQLVIDELPPAASAELVLSQIEEITNPKPKGNKKVLTAEQQQTKAAMLALLDGVRNECDQETPMRLVFEPRTSKIDRDQFVNSLLVQTALEGNCPMNLVLIGTDGRPQQKSLLTILNEWVSVRIQTVKRRSHARLVRVEARLHILEGRCIAIDNIERVIEIIRFDATPKETLMKEFKLSEIQTDDILELRLRQLANLEFERVKEEMDRLTSEKNSLERLIKSDKLLRQLVAKETKEAIKLYGDERRTLVQEAQKASYEQQVINDPVTVIVSQKGYVRSRSGHGHDVSLMTYKIGDSLLSSYEVMTEDTLIAVGSNGRVYSVSVSDLPSARGDGLPVTSFIDLETKTDIVGYVVGNDKTRILLANDEGFGLLCSIKDLHARVRAGKAFMKVEDNHRMLAPCVVPESCDRIACLSAQGRLLVFELTEMRTLKDGGKGVTLMELNPGEKLIDCLTASEEGCVVRGQGRSKSREKTLTHADWERHYGHRARKGKNLEIRFIATNLVPIKKNTLGMIEKSENEEQPEPTLL